MASAPRASRARATVPLAGLMVFRSSMRVSRKLIGQFLVAIRSARSALSSSRWRKPGKLPGEEGGERSGGVAFGIELMEQEGTEQHFAAGIAGAFLLGQARFECSALILDLSQAFRDRFAR